MRGGPPHRVRTRWPSCTSRLGALGARIQTAAPELRSVRPACRRYSTIQRARLRDVCPYRPRPSDIARSMPALTQRRPDLVELRTKIGSDRRSLVNWHAICLATPVLGRDAAVEQAGLRGDETNRADTDDADGCARPRSESSRNSWTGCAGPSTPAAAGQDHVSMIHAGRARFGDKARDRCRSCGGFAVLRDDDDRVSPSTRPWLARYKASPPVNTSNGPTSRVPDAL